MRDPTTNELFERFRRDGDAAALGVVFDRTAAALLKVARHLVADRAAAEDVVQDTFLAAIQGAPSFDASRPVEPWLFGILVNQAGLARRKVRRFVAWSGAERRDPVLERGPLEEAAAREAATAVERVLGELPAVYREVLTPRLVRGARGVEIARSVGRTPSVVRAQIHRGLQLLRRLLPAGIASALALLLPAQRALARVREHVLEQAVASSGIPLVSASNLIGGILVSKKLVGIGLAVAVALTTIGVSWWALDSAESPVVLGTGEEAQLALADALTRAPAAPPTEIEAARADVDSATRPGAAPADPMPESYRAALSGVTGRIVSADHAPLPNLEVELLEFRVDPMLADQNALFSGAAASPTLVVGTVRTDGTGRFRLDGAYCSGLHGVGVDPGGPRAQLRIVDVALAPGAVTDLGDVVLARIVAWAGLVVDSERRPVAGARVRAVPIALPLSAVGAEHYRPNSRVIDLRNEPPRVVDLPTWLPGWIEHLPFPVATTGRDGRFEIVGVPQGVASLLIDHDGFVSAAIGPEPGGNGARHDVGIVELSRGRTAEGRVVDGEGRPVAGAEVIVAAVPALGRLALARSVDGRGVSASDGSFHCARMPEDGPLVAAARVTPASGFTVGPRTEDETALIVTIDRGASHTFVLRDVAGAPVDDVTFRVAPKYDNDPLVSTWVGSFDLAGSVHPLSAGTYRLQPLPAIGSRVLIRSDANGMRGFSLEREDDGGTTEVVFTRPRRMRISVVDSGTARPVEWASVLAYRASENLIPLVRGKTDPSGAADLEVAEADDVMIRVEHPGFAPRAVAMPPGVSEWTITLDAGGAIVGRVSESGNVPREAKTIVLMWQGDGSSAELTQAHEILQPIVTTTDVRGDFRVVNLMPGNYRWWIYPRILTGNPFELLMTIDGVKALQSDSIRVTAGDATRLDVDLGPIGPQGSAVVRGRVLLDGLPIEGSELSASGAARYRTARTDEDGRFEIEELAAGRISLSLMLVTDTGQGSNIEQVRSDSFELRDGEVKEIDWSFRATPVAVRVKGPDGAPVEGAQVMLYGTDDDNSGLFRFATTDAEGRAEPVALLPGMYNVSAKHPAIGRGNKTVGVPAGGLQVPAEIALDAGVPCAGHLVTDGVSLDPDTSLTLELIELGSNESFDFQIEVGAKTFDLRGLAAGRYHAVLIQQAEVSEPFEFTLPPAGNRSLVLAFRPRPR